MTELPPVPQGHVGTVVTFLEMRRRPAVPVPASPLRLARWSAPDVAGYRALFRRVGGRWLWYSRLAMDDRTLAASIAEVHLVYGADSRDPVGMVEIERLERGAVQIRFLGLVPELAGQGHGRWLMAAALAAAWAQDTSIVRVTTCSLDHPAALPAYLRAGFVAVGRAFEHFPDPRLTGLLPSDAAPQIPVIGRG